MTRMTTSRPVIWGAGGTAVLLVALITYVVLTAGGGDDEGSSALPTRGNGVGKATSTASPAPVYSAPDQWTEPNDVGFPHTTLGAVSMLAALSGADVEGGRTFVDEQVGQYQSYMSRADRSPTNEASMRRAAEKTDASLRSSLGIPASGDMPPGAYVRSHTIGFEVIKAKENEVSVYMLAHVTMKAGALEREKGSYARTVMAAAWEDGDWRLSIAAVTRAAQEVKGKTRPVVAAPGDAAFNDAGWTAIRTAS